MNSHDSFMYLGMIDQEYASCHHEAESNFWIQPSASVLPQRDSPCSEFVVLPEIPLQPGISPEPPSLSNVNTGEGCHGKRADCITEEEQTRSEGIIEVHGCVREKLTNKLRRTRSAEVHNVSERRHRDRIKRKVSALQELMPHCKKKDTASILEDAVEYIKTLELQFDMLAKPAGAECLVPYMPCSANLFMQLPSIQSFVPVRPGFGMGIGMMFGAGMPGLAYSAHGAPLMQHPAVGLSSSAIAGFPFFS